MNDPLTSTWPARRFERVLNMIDSKRYSDPTIEIPLRLVADVAVLHTADLRAAASKTADFYRDGTVFMLEWPRQDRLIDRRVLSPRLADAIAAHRGPGLKDHEWSAAAKALRTFYSSTELRSVWTQFVLDGRQWWLDHLPPALIGHVNRDAVFQPLPRTALARRAQLRSHP